MKRVVVTLSALAVLAVLSCGGNKTPSQAAVTPAEKVDPMGKYDPPITVTTERALTQMIQYDQSDPDKRSLEENRWVRVIRENLGITMTHKWTSPDAPSDLAKWNTAIASRDVPDFAVVNDQVYKLLFEADLIADMTDIFAQYGSGNYISLMTDADFLQMKPDGKLRGFPAPGKGYHGTTLLFVRQDWLDKLGLPLPETLEDVISTARAFKAAQLGGANTIGLLFSNNLSGSVDFVAGDGKWDGFFNGYGAYVNYWLEKDGKLAYSGIQGEVKEALLAMQALYKEGLINRDIAATTDIQAREYVASGKAGIFYATAWNPTMAMQTLYDSDPEHKAVCVAILPPAARNRGPFKIQTNVPKPQRIFVSALSRHPEAIVKIANFYDWARNVDVQYYSQGADGFPYFQLMPWAQFSAPTDDLDRGEAIRYAELTGSKEKLNTQIFERAWDVYQLAAEGKAPHWHLALFGKAGTFSLLYDAYHADKILVDKYLGLPTDTQILKGEILNSELKAAYYEVVMGADISVFERAAERWLANGGSQITAEVNRWYQSTLGK